MVQIFPPLQVRPAVPGDAAAIVALIRRLAAFEQADPTALGLSEETVRRDAFGAEPRFEVLLAEENTRPCGVLTLLRAYSSWAGAPALLIHDLFVEGGARGKGAGRALLVAVAARARALGCCRLDVNVLAWNRPARRFYESLGFMPLSDWIPHRLDGAGLERLGATPIHFAPRDDVAAQAGLCHQTVSEHAPDREQAGECQAAASGTHADKGNRMLPFPITVEEPEDMPMALGLPKPEEQELAKLEARETSPSISFH